MMVVTTRPGETVTLGDNAGRSRAILITVKEIEDGHVVFSIDQGVPTSQDASSPGPEARQETSASIDDMLGAVDRLGPSDMEALVAGVLELRARRLAPLVPAIESDLLFRINEGLPADFSRRLGELMAKRDAGSLTDDEYNELLQLGDEVERREGERLKALGELAALRQIPLPALMRDLGLAPSVDG